MDYRNMEINQPILEGNEISRHGQRFLFEVFFRKLYITQRMNNYNWFKTMTSNVVLWIKLLLQRDSNWVVVAMWVEWLYYYCKR